MGLIPPKKWTPSLADECLPHRERGSASLALGKSRRGHDPPLRICMVPANYSIAAQTRTETCFIMRFYAFTAKHCRSHAHMHKDMHMHIYIRAHTHYTCTSYTCTPYMYTQYTCTEHGQRGAASRLNSSNGGTEGRGQGGGQQGKHKRHAHTHTHTKAHTYTHARTHKHTYTYTHKV